MARAKNAVWVYNELLCEPVAVAEIQLWLEERGVSIRSSQ